MNKERIIVIGASAGGVEALLGMAPLLSPNLAAPVVVVLHIGEHRSLLPNLLSSKGPNPAIFAQTGIVPHPGMIYVAPPDHHVLVAGNKLVLQRGPKEHHARPAINPLFRSVAIDQGPRVIGVILTGKLDDGAAGLHAIKACGGTTIVQDPNEAREPSMPLQAIAGTSVDHIVRLDEMTKLINTLAQPLNSTSQNKTPEWLKTEHAVTLGAGMAELSRIGSPSGFTCPDCGGCLFEIKEGKPVRFLCHTGHAFSLLSLAELQDNVAEDNLWAALRALQEKEALLRKLCEVQTKDGVAGATKTLQEAEKLANFIQQMRCMVWENPESEATEKVD